MFYVQYIDFSSYSLNVYFGQLFYSLSTLLPSSGKKVKQFKYFGVKMSAW